MAEAPHIAHTAANIATIVCVVWRMNNMDRNTPWLDMAAWWTLGVGMFWELVTPREIDTGHMLVSIGIALIAMVLTQPDWRPYIANRRNRPETPLPKDCDRRCVTFMRTRKQAHLDDSGVAEA